MYLQIIGLLSSRYAMEFFIASNVVRVLDHYQYYHCSVKHFKYLCGNQLILIYVWDDAELLWIKSNIRNVYPRFLRTIPHIFVCNVYFAFNSLRNRGLHPVLLE